MLWSIFRGSFRGRGYILGTILIVLLVLTWGVSAAACPVCYQADGIANPYWPAILVLLLVPFSLIGTVAAVIGWMYWRRNLRH
jgi:cell division protein FtsX